MKCLAQDYASKYRSWYDWKWQFAHRITNAEMLAKVIDLTEQDKREITKCLEKFRMAITPYYASLLLRSERSDPLRREAVPRIEETYFHEDDLADPLNEEADSPVPHIVHRYPDRVLFLVTYICSTYCRYCTRRRAVGEEDKVITAKELKPALQYIREHTEIRDVLISGGDPLVMSTKKLERIIAGLRAIPHVEIIRIGTRVPAVMPMRITAELLEMLKKYHPLWINTHFNHPREVTADAQQACTAIVDAGIPLGNQSVLLRGVNDDPEIMKELLLKLVQMRVRPYYLYQCDLSRGIAHFRTEVETGIGIIHKLTGNISGYAIPKYVIDAPCGGGKIPINYNYVLSKNDQEIIMENYKGDIYKYPLPQKTSSLKKPGAAAAVAGSDKLETQGIVATAGGKLETQGIAATAAGGRWEMQGIAATAAGGRWETQGTVAVAAGGRWETQGTVAVAAGSRLGELTFAAPDHPETKEVGLPPAESFF